jgi:hypothetical protein
VTVQQHVRQQNNGIGRWHGAVLNCRHELMRKVEKIEQDVQALSPDELAEFRAWFLEHDWAAWDRQLERDVQNGRLDALAEKALRDHAAGKTTRL